ncbi:nuclear transport factor 2 family protein [Sneathiella sp.]|uniref:nuclear transport factor 2 family protein n=1 Tax=Sneathiella sp. TaxID=1964365 RepID=UPI00260A9E54|nr:nuclear transport factor 2 family protein [Sneathiella sp.]MDF2367859.1 nuclear transport factor 2 family protein [Sneathiella sp.]
MPTRERVEEFIEMVVSGAHVRAITDFYHADASMQENLKAPRRGRETLEAHEAAALARVQKVHTHPDPVFLVDGDHVAINWTFDFTDKSGNTRRLEELALQHWDGDRIRKEQFFYDTASAWAEV